jgi:DNA polymerase III subunit epsilon
MPLSIITNWFGSGDRLPEAVRPALGDWADLPEPALTLPHADARYVVVDTETTGLNTRTDTLLSIGAVAFSNGAVEVSDSFSATLRPEKAYHGESVLIHGLGGDAQLAGGEPVAALADFLRYAGKAPLVAFHAPFDEVMIKRALDKHLGLTFRRKWVDLAELCPIVFQKGFESLDEWLGYFGIDNPARHDALGDAFATAQLLQVLLAHAPQERHFKALRALEKAGRWVGA